MKKTEPLISVILTTYNCENFLDTVIPYLLNQTYKNCEFLVLDDASTDNTQTLLKEYARKDKRIRLFLQQKNSGAYILRNLGLQESTGEYIIFCDSDDYYKDLEAFRKLHDAIIETQADISMGAVDIWDDKNKKIVKKDNFSTITKEKNDSLFISYSFLMQKAFIYRVSLFAKLFKSSLIRENNLSFLGESRFGEDFIFSLEYYMKCKNGLIFIEDPIYVYRINTGENITSNVKTNLKRLEQWKDIFALYERENILEKCLEEIVCTFYSGTAGTIYSSRKDKFLLEKTYFKTHHLISKKLPKHKIPKRVDIFNRIGFTLNNISPQLGFAYYSFFYKNDLIFSLLNKVKNKVYNNGKEN